MITAGCDIGSLTTKAVLIKDSILLGRVISASSASVVESARVAMDQLLSASGLAYSDINYCIATGYGRELIPFANENLSEISCHGKGAQWLVPGVRTVIDGGGQDCKAMIVDDRGDLRDFRVNMKCQAGTGRASELMAESLGIDVSELGPLALRAVKPELLHEPCCLLTQVEIRHLLLKGASPPDVAAGICDYIATQIINLLRNMDVEPDVAFTGGMAKNIGIFAALEKALKVSFVNLPEDPQLIGAIGAAVYASEKDLFTCDGDG